MKHCNLMQDENGNTFIWAAIIILALCMLMAVVYNVIFIYTNVNTAKLDMERATVVTVNESLINENVRDLIHAIPESPAIDYFYANLEDAGYIKSGNTYFKKENGQEKYSISNIELTFDGEQMEITADFSIPLLWEIGDISEIVIPIKTLSRVYYIEY